MKNIKNIILGLFLFLFSFSASCFADCGDGVCEVAEDNLTCSADCGYIDLIVKVHTNDIDGQLYSFNPESTDPVVMNSVFSNTFDASASTDYSQNRDFARSLFLKASGYSTFSTYEEGKVYTEAVLLANAVPIVGSSEVFAENTDGDGFFILSPYDGFLHFKLRKELLGQSGTFDIGLVAPDQIASFSIYDTALNTANRAENPYGYFSELAGNGIFSESIKFADISSDVKKLQIDLVIVDNPDENIDIIAPDTTGADWEPNALITFAQKFALRGHYALDWTLNIDDSGMDHRSISEYYKIIIDAVNAVLILIILAIAFLWNFSAIVPKAILKKIVILYAIVAIFVNLTAPISKLMVDGANLLQNTFLQTEGVDGEMRKLSADDLFDYGDSNYNDFSGYALENSVVPTYQKGISQVDLSENGSSANITAGTINTIGAIDATGTTTSTSSTIGDITHEIFVPQRSEDRVFNSAMLILTGIGFFLLSCLFLFRIIVLWFLIILSPLFVILVILPATQKYFKHWLNMFMRWIIIGPLLAICLGATVFIWQKIGIPITSLYSSDVQFAQSGNFLLASPGSSSAGLNHTKPMMEYIASLIMLYLPVILAFALTRSAITNSAGFINSTESSNFSKLIEKNNQKDTKNSDYRSEKGTIKSIRELLQVHDDTDFSMRGKTTEDSNSSKSFSSLLSFYDEKKTENQSNSEILTNKKKEELDETKSKEKNITSNAKNASVDSKSENKESTEREHEISKTVNSDKDSSIDEIIRSQIKQSESNQNEVSENISNKTKTNENTSVPKTETLGANENSVPSKVNIKSSSGKISETKVLGGSTKNTESGLSSLKEEQRENIISTNNHLHIAVDNKNESKNAENSTITNNEVQNTKSVSENNLAQNSLNQEDRNEKNLENNTVNNSEIKNRNLHSSIGIQEEKRRIRREEEESVKKEDLLVVAHEEEKKEIKEKSNIDKIVNSDKSSNIDGVKDNISVIIHHNEEGTESDNSSTNIQENKSTPLFAQDKEEEKENDSFTEKLRENEDLHIFPKEEDKNLQSDLSLGEAERKYKKDKNNS